MGGDRLVREREFHDHAFEHAVREPVSKFYTVARRANEAYTAALERIVAGSSVLEYGCGEGSNSFQLARRCDVTGIDISPIGVAHAQDEARRLGLTRAKYAVMNAEALTFPDRSFDVVCGSGILHHLSLEPAFAEVARVLRPSGTAVFYEPLGHNPLINAYRVRTPQYRSPDEHPLRASDLAAARRRFLSVECRYFILSALAAVPLRRTPLFVPVLRVLECIDRMAFALTPPIRRYAWIVVISCRGPLPSDGTTAVHDGEPAVR